MSGSSELPENFKSPKYWPTWLLVGLMKFLARLGMKNQMRVGRIIGALAYRLVPRRRKITETNIRLCFSELDDEQRALLTRRCITDNAIGLVETARAWFGDPESLRAQLRVEGLEHLNRAAAEGRGVLVVGAHYSALDLGSVMASLFIPFNIMYRPMDNPLLDAIMKASRNRSARAIDKRDMRTTIRVLKAGEVLWYAPDQDYGREMSVFAPFFDVPAATITATTRLANINRSPVLVISYHRNTDDSGYTLRFSEPLVGFPCGDEVADATRINALLEEEIRREPSQYMWVHRRFKTRPEGEPSIY